MVQKMVKTLKKCVKWYLKQSAKNYTMLPTGMVPHDVKILD